jgi:hypothetical protein
MQINDSSVPYYAVLLVVALGATWFLAAELTEATAILANPEPEEPVVRLNGVVAASRLADAGDSVDNGPDAGPAPRRLEFQIESRETRFSVPAEQLRAPTDSVPPVAAGDSVYVEVTTAEWSRHPDAPRVRLLAAHGDTLTQAAATSAITEWTRTARRVLLWLLTAASLSAAVFAISRIRDGLTDDDRTENNRTENDRPTEDRPIEGRPTKPGA